MKSNKIVEYISQDWRTLLSVDERKQYSADFIQEWSRRSCGLSSKKISTTVDELVLSMQDDKLFIASVGHGFLGIKKHGHLVLVYAITIVNDQIMILINNPSPYGKQNYCISFDEFRSSL